MPHILGPVLNGGGFAAIRDTDGGSYDGDAAGTARSAPMQFIPSTWAGYAADGNDNGVSSPHNVYDATLAAGKYLCSGGLDLSNPQDRATAVCRYNHSDSYVATVLLWADAYANGFHPMPSDPVPPDNDAATSALGPPSTPATRRLRSRSRAPTSRSRRRRDSTHEDPAAGDRADHEDRRRRAPDDDHRRPDDDTTTTDDDHHDDDRPPAEQPHDERDDRRADDDHAPRPAATESAEQSPPRTAAESLRRSCTCRRR